MSIFTTKSGERVTWQAPNLPIIIWFVFMVLSVVSSGDISDHARIVSLASLGVWALLEIFTGVNTFRKILGSVVLSLLIIALLY